MHMNLLISSQQYHHQHIRHDYTHPAKPNHSPDENINKANLVYCQGKHCELITEFKIADNNTFDCTEQYLGITFEVVILNEHGNDTEKVKVHSWLFNDEREYNRDFNVLSNKQKTSTSCKQIRR